MRSGADTLRVMVTAMDLNSTGTRVETRAAGAFAVVVLPINDAPRLATSVFKVTVLEDGTADLGTSAGLLVSDVDAGEPRYQNASNAKLYSGSSSMTAVLSVNHGTLWVPQRYAGGVQLLHLKDAVLDASGAIALDSSVLLRTYDSEGAGGDGAA